MFIFGDHVSTRALTESLLVTNSVKVLLMPVTFWKTPSPICSLSFMFVGGTNNSFFRLETAKGSDNRVPFSLMKLPQSVLAPDCAQVNGELQRFGD